MNEEQYFILLSAWKFDTRYEYEEVAKTIYTIEEISRGACRCEAEAPCHPSLSIVELLILGIWTHSALGDQLS